MSDTLFQPVLPVEAPFTEAELHFMDDEPYGIFPANQDSNWGLLRKIFSNRMQLIIDQQSIIWNEAFVDTASQFLDVWEQQMGLPSAASLTIAQRRNRLAARLIRGPYTRAVRDFIIESYLLQTMGSPSSFGDEGLIFDSGGISLFGEAGAVSTLYRVYENPADFSYAVWIVNTTTPDIPSLTRDLARFTPAGINFTIDNTKSNILDYQRAALTDGPTVYWPLATTSGTGAPYQSIAGITSVLVQEGSPTNTGALISNGGGVVGDTQARLFDGIDDAYSIPTGPHMSTGNSFSLEAWIRRTVSPTNFEMIFSAGLPYLAVDAAGQLVLSQEIDGVQRSTDTAVSGASAIISNNTTYHVVGTYDGKTLKIYINGALVRTGSYAGNGAPYYVVHIGKHWGNIYYWKGTIDEPKIFGYPLSQAQILRRYRTGTNQL